MRMKLYKSVEYEEYKYEEGDTLSGNCGFGGILIRIWDWINWEISAKLEILKWKRK